MNIIKYYNYTKKVMKKFSQNKIVFKFEKCLTLNANRPLKHKTNAHFDTRLFIGIITKNFDMLFYDNINKTLHFHKRNKNQLLSSTNDTFI